MTRKEILALAEVRERAVNQIAITLQQLGLSFTPALESELESYLLEFDIVGGRFVFDSSSLSTFARLAERLRAWLRVRGVQVAEAIILGLETLFDANLTYFREVVGAAAEALAPSVGERILTSLGYDVARLTVAENSALAGVIDAEQVASQILSVYQRGIATSSLIEDVRANIKELVGEGEAKGVYEKYLFNEGGELLISTDRQIQRVYAFDLDLRHSFYSGTAKDNTRDFCLERLNLLYDEVEVEKWKNLQWKGKKRVHDIWTDCGGYNCRHHYSFVSPELVETLDLSVNTYHRI